MGFCLETYIIIIKQIIIKDDRMAKKEGQNALPRKPEYWTAREHAAPGLAQFVLAM